MSTASENIVEYQKKFGLQLKKIRHTKGMSQLDLASYCNLEKTSISRIENGRTNTTLKTMVILSTALEVELKDLFDF
ncbi:helix-turn-helix domain-containing protein [Lutibacter sp. A80]|uniref:helix-turn-helix domain-containing protein n=1 Tax=Lutibacter sp. A80 TaxID=2918453 RepID=UPI001F06315A|nr:helix-turn-helix transcriptional regulator [Lutibacter sp. A80]UMB59891.1 helix-turn-helix domain-containing protein [Lutibacter sp. A80]